MVAILGGRFEFIIFLTRRKQAVTSRGRGRQGWRQCVCVCGCVAGDSNLSQK
jgi:hypothetical protein